MSYPRLNQLHQIAATPNKTIEVDVKGRASLALALIHCFLGIFVSALFLGLEMTHIKMDTIVDSLQD